MDRRMDLLKVLPDLPVWAVAVIIVLLWPSPVRFFLQELAVIAIELIRRRLKLRRQQSSK